MTTAENDIAGTYTGVVPLGFMFNDGSTYGTGTLTATIQARSTISATVTFTTAKGTSLGSQPLSLTYNALYDSGSSLSAISGTYTDAADSSTITISTTGVIFSEDVSGCVLNGQVFLIDTSYDAYQISYTFSSCVGSTTFLNGATATGLGVLDTTASPNVLYVGVQIPASYYVLNGSYPMQ